MTVPEFSVAIRSLLVLINGILRSVFVERRNRHRDILWIVFSNSLGKENLKIRKLAWLSLFLQDY